MAMVDSWKWPFSMVLRGKLKIL